MMVFEWSPPQPEAVPASRRAWYGNECYCANARWWYSQPISWRRISRPVSERDRGAASRKEPRRGQAFSVYYYPPAPENSGSFRRPQHNRPGHMGWQLHLGTANQTGLLMQLLKTDPLGAVTPTICLGWVFLFSSSASLVLSLSSSNPKWRRN